VNPLEVGSGFGVGGGRGRRYKDVSTVKLLNSFIFTCLIDFFNKTGFQGLMVHRDSENIKNV